MLANIPFTNTKCGIVQRGRKWSEIDEHLLNVETPQFKVGQRGVWERYSLLAKTREDEGASGISTPELTELDQAPGDLVVREGEADGGTQEIRQQHKRER